MGDLTRNFSRSEFDRASSGGTFPSAANLQPLAELAQWLRDLAGVPGTVTSAFRSPTDNTHVGGSSVSQHMSSEAVDVYFGLVPLRTLADRILASIADGSAPYYGQVIVYPSEGHVHVSLPTLGARNGETRYAADDGSYPFLTDTVAQLPLASGAQVRQGFTWPAASSSPPASSSGSRGRAD